MGVKRRLPPKRKPLVFEVDAYSCPEGHIHIDFAQGPTRLHFCGTPEEGYDIAQQILRAYDEAVGIEEPRPYLTSET